MLGRGPENNAPEDSCLEYLRLFGGYNVSAPTGESDLPECSGSRDKGQLHSSTRMCVCVRERGRWQGERGGKDLSEVWGLEGGGEQPGLCPQILTVVSVDNLEVLD